MPVNADRERIDQLLASLLDRAVKLSPGGRPMAVPEEFDGA